jgi:hypothetical protein
LVTETKPSTLCRDFNKDKEIINVLKAIFHNMTIEFERLNVSYRAMQFFT